MTVVVIGPPGAGKTRLGTQLAQRLGLAFIDTDARVVAEHGAIAEIFAVHGEPHFRALERVAVSTALREGGVVSLGGGAVLDADTRAELAGVRVVLLTVQPEAVARRIAGGARPLITDIESWKRLVADRADLYASLADYTVDTSSRSIETIVEEIADWVEWRKDTE